MAVPTHAWVLPRPKPDCYPGGFPLHFEKKLIRMLGNPVKVLHPFGGMAEIGTRCDLRTTHPLAARFGTSVRWKCPDVIADAHYLPFADESFDCVICDPPYSKQESSELYGTGPLFYKKYIAEAVRVTKIGGYVASYHVTMTARPPGTEFHMRILLGTRTWHRLRACCVFRRSVTMPVDGQANAPR